MNHPIELFTAYNHTSSSIYVASRYLGRELEALSCAPTADGQYTVIQFVEGPCRIVRNKTIHPETLTPRQRIIAARVGREIRAQREAANV